MISTVRAAASGYKTYIVAILVVVLALVEGVLGIDVPGVDTGDEWLVYLLNGLGLGSLRAGVAKAALNTVLRR